MFLAKLLNSITSNNVNPYIFLSRNQYKIIRNLSQLALEKVNVSFWFIVYNHKFQKVKFFCLFI